MSSAEGESTLLEKYLEEIKSLKCNGNCDKATQDEVKQLKDQLRLLKAELASLKQALGMKNNLFFGLLGNPLTDSGYSDVIAESSSYSSSYISSTPKSIYSTCSCGSRMTSGSSNSDFCTRPDDLSQMSGPLTEESILKILHQRWKFGECQTRIGSVLLTFNPHRGIPIHQAFQYSQLGQSLPLCQLANEIIRNLQDRGTPQAVILCGESGAGKSYTSQLLLRQLYDLSGQSSDEESFKLLTAANQVMRALTSCGTGANQNSTRMGCVTELIYMRGVLDRIRFNPLWTDQCRVFGPPDGESNFHIFKMLLFGLTPEEKGKLHLQGFTVSKLRCLSQTDGEDVDHHRIQFECFRHALSNLGIEFMDVMRVLSAIMLLGNLEFKDIGGYELDMMGNEEIKSVASLLGVSGVSLYHALTSRTHAHNGQVVKTLCNATKANHHRASLAKALYCRTVLSIIRRINTVCKFEHKYATLLAPGDDGTLTPSDSNPLFPNQISPTSSVSSYTSQSTMYTAVPSPQHIIQILDLPGFQSSQCNRLSQLLSNASAERLHQFYTYSIFQSNIDISKAERIPCDIEIAYTDNTQLTEVFFNKKAGLFPCLDESSVQRHTDTKTFLQSISDKNKEKRFLKLSSCKECFLIQHTGREVEYDASDIIGSNRDVVGDELIGIFSKKHSNFGYVTHLFAPELKLLKGNKSQGLLFRICPSPPSSNNNETETISSLSKDYCYRLETVLEKMKDAHKHFVLCVKTNDKQAANIFELDIVERQLRTLQVTPSVQLSAAGFPHHLEFSEFVQSYGCLRRSSKSYQKSSDNCKEQSKDILDALLERINKSKMPYMSTRWRLGHTSVFLSDETKRCLEHFRSVRREEAAVYLQAQVRRLICVRWWREQRKTMKVKKKKRVQMKEPIYERIPVSPTPFDWDDYEEQKRREEVIVDEDENVYMEACPVYDMDTDVIPAKRTPPPLPRNHPCHESIESAAGEYPQTRVMTCDFPSSAPFLRAGEPVLVMGKTEAKEELYIEHENCLFKVPDHMTELQGKGQSLGTRL